MLLFAAYIPAVLVAVLAEKYHPQEGFLSKRSTESRYASRTTSILETAEPSQESNSVPTDASSLVAVNWPAPTYCSNYTPYPQMYYGMDMTQFRRKEKAWNKDIKSQTINLTIVSNCMPLLDMAENMKIANVTGYPNQGKPFPVKGMDINKVLWFTEAHNRQRSDPVVLFFHGGGLFSPILASHPAAIDQLYRTLPANRLSWLSVDHTLTSYKKYPQQLREFVAVYNELLKTTGNNILLSDSSGAHEALELPIHMQSPFETVEPIRPIMQPRHF